MNEKRVIIGYDISKGCVTKYRYIWKMFYASRVGKILSIKLVKLLGVIFIFLLVKKGLDWGSVPSDQLIMLWKHLVVIFSLIAIVQEEVLMFWEMVKIKISYLKIAKQQKMNIVIEFSDDGYTLKYGDFEQNIHSKRIGETKDFFLLAEGYFIIEKRKLKKIEEERIRNIYTNIVQL